ncbi:Uncharacterised protein [Yersinia bercovieri]|nr:Uncharacterised protein [Yersinia bercovieri]CNI59186.1 Uncharacterised protein [Yersinia bercovieri]
MVIRVGCVALLGYGQLPFALDATAVLAALTHPNHLLE